MSVSLAAIGAIASLGSAIYGAAKSSSQNKQALDLLERNKNKQEAWYNARRMEDYTQRADAQNVINRQREMLEQRYKAARASGVVGGASEESVALQKEAANTAMANTMGDIAAQGAQYKDNIDRDRMQMEASYANQQAQIKQSQANATAQAAAQVANAGINLVGNELNAKGQQRAYADGMAAEGLANVTPVNTADAIANAEAAAAANDAQFLNDIKKIKL